MACLPDGFKAMVPAILILVFAWTLKSMTDSLGAAEYVAGIVAGSAEGIVIGKRSADKKIMDEPLCYVYSC